MSYADPTKLEMLFWMMKASRTFTRPSPEDFLLADTSDGSEGVYVAEARLWHPLRDDGLVEDMPGMACAARLTDKGQQAISMLLGETTMSGYRQPNWVLEELTKDGTPYRRAFDAAFKDRVSARLYESRDIAWEMFESSGHPDKFRKFTPTEAVIFVLGIRGEKEGVSDVASLKA